MKNKYLLPIALCLGMILIQCDKNNDQKCDSTKHKDKTYLLTAPVNANAGGLQFDTYLNGSTRFFNWSRDEYFICIYSLATAHIEVLSFDGVNASDYIVTGHVLFDIPPVIQNIGTIPFPNRVTGKVSVDLQPAFGTGSGNLSTVIELSFPTQGNLDADIIYLLNKVKSVSIRLEYTET